VTRVENLDAPAVLAWLRQHVPSTAHLCLDSRRVHCGDVFFACARQHPDRCRHIEEAVKAGAAAVVVQADCAADAAPVPLPVPCLRVQGLVQRLGTIAHAWYGAPSHALTVIAVTGTNGKTSTVQWLAAALCAGHVPCGAIGTLGMTLPDGAQVDGALTTPDVLTLHRHLARLRDVGAVAVALEASSIGIAQGRLDGVRIAFAGFTNLSHDHLDYHHDMAQYRAAKFALFAQADLRGAVINLDDAAGADLFERLPVAQRLGYACRPVAQAAVTASAVQVAAHGQVFQLTLPDGSAQLVTPIPGAHNVSNLLLVAGMLHWMGWPLPRVVQALTTLRPVPGRLQVVAPPASVAAHTMPTVVVDYAHTPDALQHALQTLRQTTQASQGSLTVVFGCGGNRDAAKRPLMGKIAHDSADRVIVTSDNPRDEVPHTIAASIVQGLSPAPRVILERAQAILIAILDAAPGDVVLLAGKGHETWQEVHGERKPFDDRAWAALALTWRAALAVCAQSVCTDTRTLQPGQLFVALRGETFDGHAYLAQAAQAGAVGAVVAQRDPNVDIPQVCVGDTLAALGHLGAAWRQRHRLPLVAVTGSNGKTTTKEMLAAILRAHLGEDAVLVTHGNLNNAIGVPLTLLRLRAQHRAAVVELGMNHPGEIAGLAAMAQPTVVLVNNAQREHQEFMGTVQAVARENGMALLALPPDGVAVTPGCDAYAHVWDALVAHSQRLRFGFSQDSGHSEHAAHQAGAADPALPRAALDVTADALRLYDDHATFRLHLPTGTVEIALAIAGLHNIHNALAAATCAHALGVPAPVIAQGLADFRPVTGRMRMMTARGMRVIDDSYNANPDSVRAAIDVLARLGGARTLVLGDMAEVGAARDAAHAEVGAYARARGIQILLTLGEACAHAVAAFGAGARGFEDVHALVDAIVQAPPAHVLVKGSRFMRMERVVDALLAHDAQRKNSSCS